MNQQTLTCKEIYEKIYSTMKQKYFISHITIQHLMSQDKANRLANIYAVKNTVKEWKKQFKDKNENN